MAVSIVKKGVSVGRNLLKKKPSTVRESAQKARHHHAATAKALTRQQGVIREEAKKAGMRVNAYKQKFPNRPSVKKLMELQKQNETVKNKQFKKGRRVGTPRGCGAAKRGYGKAMKG